MIALSADVNQLDFNAMNALCVNTYMYVYAFDNERGLSGSWIMRRVVGKAKGSNKIDFFSDISSQYTLRIIREKYCISLIFILSTWVCNSFIVASS